jgi:hypothetical protein
VLGCHPALCCVGFCCVATRQTRTILNPTTQNPIPRESCWWSYGRGQAAVYGAGLREVGGFRRHAPLRGAWWGATVSTDGLYQVSF